MAIEVFKTNVQHVHQSIWLTGIIIRRFSGLQVNFDLEDCDKILRVEGAVIPMEEISRILQSHGYLCKPLE